jgi:predicted XRE-type DNA-binding protein
MKIQKAQSNIYADIGAKDAEGMLIKAKLALEIGEIIRHKKLSQMRAAALMGISQPKLSELLRGRFRAISEAKMMACLTRLGASVSIVVKYGNDKASIVEYERPRPAISSVRGRINVEDHSRQLREMELHER